MKKTRVNKNKPNTPKNKGKVEKIYYVIIGLLVVILGGLVIFIFADQGDVVTDDEANGTPDSEIVFDADQEDTEEALDEDAENADEESENLDETEEDTEQDVDPEADEPDDTEEETNATDESEESDNAAEEDTNEEETVNGDINTDAPLNESYTINFNDGSSDRNAIEQNASAVSGISQGDMITWWVGNNGPGRAFIVLSDGGQNTIYRVYLQYGDDEWHVTEAEELDSVPAEYR